MKSGKAANLNDAYVKSADALRRFLRFYTADMLRPSEPGEPGSNRNEGGCNSPEHSPAQTLPVPGIPSFQSGKPGRNETSPRFSFGDSRPRQNNGIHALWPFLPF